ncbi:MAG: ERCC4 domain-containing protein, partial [Anaerolineales bacterium]|nr:ERCC4 domain-containing protein [Anaerolineales bacterium]
MNVTNTSIIECPKCSQKNRLTQRPSSGYYSCAKCGSRLKDPFGLDDSIQITVDSREHASNIAQILQTMPKTSIKVKSLEIGDYLVSDEVVVERKTADDFAASITDGRLIQQAEFIAASSFHQAIYIIEGDLSDMHSEISQNAISGALSYLVALKQIAVIPTTDVNASARLIHDMARHLQEGLGYEVPLRSGKKKTLSLQRQFLVEGLPSVGPVAAQRLLEHFGSPAAVFSATEDEL